MAPTLARTATGAAGTETPICGTWTSGLDRHRTPRTEILLGGRVQLRAGPQPRRLRRVRETVVVLEDALRRLFESPQHGDDEVRLRLVRAVDVEVAPAERDEILVRAGEELRGEGHLLGAVFLDHRVDR